MINTSTQFPNEGSMNQDTSSSMEIQKEVQIDSGEDSIKPKKKINIKFIIGAFVLLLIVLGGAAGFYLTQFSSGDIRQQAYQGQSCTVDTNCNGWPNEECVNGTCQPTNPGTNCPAFSAWGSCDPTPGTEANECTGSHYTNSTCVLGYKEWRCGNKNWIPDYGNPNNNSCSSQCPWPETNGVCCPVGGDACNPSTDNYKCIADPFVAHCESWNNSACPASQQGYWKAIEWCVGEGCECGPGGLFEGYSGPGCDCGGGGINCNDRCDNNSQCQAVNSGWSCVTASDGLKRCRLTANPSSTSCTQGGGINCNDSCTSNSQCSNVNSGWFCDPASNRCRLQSNPTSTSCQPGTTTYQCNSNCSTTAQCQGDLGSNYSCVSNKCRLTSNPTSATCQPASAQCNSVCTSDSQCPANTKCLTTYDFTNQWENVTGNVSNVGSGNITAFESFVKNNTVEQYLVRGGKIWHRPNLTATWSDVTNNVSNVGSGDITSFNVYVTTSGAVEQWLVRGGKIWHRPNLTTQFQDITSNVSGVGSGTITSYNVEKYSTNHGSIVSAYLVRGGKTWHHTSSNWNLWQDVTSNLNNVGSGNITDNGFLLNTDNAIYHYATRDGKIWHRKTSVSADKRCRLPAYPNSGSCQPPTGSLQCNSTCSTTAECAAVNSDWSCVSNKCRLTSNPTSATCEPATVGPMCKDVAILSQDDTELDPKQASSFYVGQVVKFRCAADDATNPLIAKYQFRITTPGNVVVEGAAINPAGKSAVSQEYTINSSGSFMAQCRICLTDNTCQPYINIGPR